MPFKFIPTFPDWLLRVIAITVCCFSIAHAQQDTSFQPKPIEPTSRVLLAAGSATSPPAQRSSARTVGSSSQGRRIALVIGNGNYQYPDNLPKLTNPVNDAEDVAKALRGFGFEVIERKNQTLEAMNQTIAEFGSRIGGSEAALFYFAGHGIQVKNQNYLMPVNAKIESEAMVPYQGVNINQVLDEMDNGKSGANIVMLDACRNNPISGKFRSGKSRGLASPGSTPKGTVIVYATDPGNVAADGDGRNGLFTAGLLTAFKGKNLSLDDVLTVASAEVERASGQTQTPYVNGPKTLQKTFHFGASADPVREDTESIYWTSIEHSTDPEDFSAYLRTYPKGSYRTLAENHLRRLKASPPVAAQTPNSPIPTSVKLAGVAQSRPALLNASESVKHVAGTLFHDCEECPAMIVIPPGAFDMGSKEYGTEKPLHRVNFAGVFALARTEVTCAQWEAIMGSVPKGGQAACAPNLPIQGVTWKEAKDFVQRLSEKSGKNYRLPTEAEWEYACRAGASTEYCGSNAIDSVGWHADATDKARPVAGKRPNDWGLYDMSGNAWEWTEDCWNANYQGAPADGSAWISGDCSRRIRRGGSWDNSLRYLRAANRDFLNSALSGGDGGFRPARTLTP